MSYHCVYTKVPWKDDREISLGQVSQGHLDNMKARVLASRSRLKRDRERGRWLWAQRVRSGL